MAVYTNISKKEIRKIAQSYQLIVRDFQAMEDGASNSNYLLDTDQGKFMLTIFEDGGFNGYQKIRPLTDIEKEHLQFFTTYGAMKTSNWRFWKYHIDKPNPQRKQAHRSMMNIAEKVVQIPKQTFINLALK